MADAESSAVRALLDGSGGASVVVQEAPEFTIVAQALAPAADVNGTDLRGNISVGVPGSNVEVTFPLSMFGALGETEVVATISTFKEGTALAEMGVGAPSEEGGSYVEAVRSMIVISVMDMAGAALSVQGLPEPITFSMPNATDTGLACGWFDEEAAAWRLDGTWVQGRGPDGSLLCATVHLTIFGALVQGLSTAFVCSQAKLLSSGSYRELIEGGWFGAAGAWLLICLLSALAIVFASACCMDYREARQGFWKPEYFLIAERPAPPVAAAGVVAAAVVADGCCGGQCDVFLDSFKTSLKEGIDDFLGGFFEYAGDLRGLCEELLAATSEGGGVGLIQRLSLSFLESSASKQACASCFLNPDDVDLLFDETAEDLLKDENDDEDEEGKESNRPTLDFDMDDTRESVCTAAPTLVRATGKDAEVDCVNNAVENNASSQMHFDTNIEWNIDGCQSAQEPTGSTSAKLRNVFSVTDEERNERIQSLREAVLQHQRDETMRFGGWCQVPRMVCMYLMAFGPLGVVYARSISVSHSMRALFLACDWLGSIMLATFFAEASGGAVGKRSPKSCSVSCEEAAAEQGHDTTAYCLLFYLGRIIAIATASALVASIPVGLIGSIHCREFKHVDYEGSPDWKYQLRKWRRADIATWVVGILYCGFAIHYILLFFANVAEADQESWLLSALICLGEDFLVLPLCSGVLISLVTIVMIVLLSWKVGVHKKDICRHGSVGDLRDLFSTTTTKADIRAALMYSDSLNSFLKSKTTALDSERSAPALESERCDSQGLHLTMDADEDAKGAPDRPDGAIGDLSPESGQATLLEGDFELPPEVDSCMVSLSLFSNHFSHGASSRELEPTGAWAREDFVGGLPVDYDSSLVVGRAWSR